MRRMSRSLAALAAVWVLMSSQAFAAGTGPDATYTWQQISAMGHLNAHNGRLLAGCHMYPWTYSIHPPQGMNWEVDVFVSGPRGKQIAAGALMTNGDALNGTRYYRLCTPSATKGTYTIVSTMNLWGTSGADQTAHLPVVHYSLS